MIDEKNQNGGIAGDIQQSRQRKAVAVGQGIGSNIPGVTESTNGQGNRSFGAHRQPPKPAGNPVVSAAKAEATGGIAAGMPGFSQLNKGASLPPSGVKPKPTIMDGWEASIPGQIVGAVKGRNPIPGTGAIYDATQERSPAISAAIDKGSYANAAGQAAGIATDAIQSNVSNLAGNAGRTIGGIAAGVEDFGRGLSGQSVSSAIQRPSGIALSSTKKPDATSVSAGMTGIAQAPTAAQSGAGGKGSADLATGFGIARSTTEGGRRSFSGTSVGAPSQVNTINMGITDAQRTGRSGVANPGFEKALAAGDYETAMKMVNRGDTSQMTRLGQLQGQLRQQRDLAAAQAADRNHNSESAATRSARESASRAMIENAQRLSDKGFSKGALRNIQAANGAETGGRSQAGTGIAAGINLSETQTADEYAQQQAATDVAQAQATQAQTTQQQQGILQGLLDQINSEDATPEQRQSLIQRYQALSGDKGATYESRVVDQYDSVGNPIGQTLYTINQRTGQSQAVQPQQQVLPSYQDAVAEAQAVIKENPAAREQVEARLQQIYQRGLPQ